VNQVLDADFVDEARRMAQFGRRGVGRGDDQVPVVVAGVAAVAEVGDLFLTPGAAIAFVGGHDIGLAVNVVGGNRIRHVNAPHARPGTDVDLAVGVRDVQAIAVNAVIFVAQRQNVGDGGGSHVQLGQRIVFLQADPGRFA